jgi:hypothetical protein
MQDELAFEVVHLYYVLVQVLSLCRCHGGAADGRLGVAQVRSEDFLEGLLDGVMIK